MIEIAERVISAGSAPHLLEKTVYERVKAKYPLYGYLLAEMGIVWRGDSPLNPEKEMIEIRTRVSGPGQRKIHATTKKGANPNGIFPSGTLH